MNKKLSHRDIKRLYNKQADSLKVALESNAKYQKAVKKLICVAGFLVGVVIWQVW